MTVQERSPGGLTLTRRALDLCPLPQGARVADMGCGTGASVRLLHERGFCAVGLDVTTQAYAPSPLSALPRVQARAENPPFAPASLDAILCQCVLSLLDNPAQCLKTFAGLCRPGGWLLLSDVYVRMPTPVDYLFSLHGMAAALRAAGWTLRHAEDHSRALALFAAQSLWHGPGSSPCGEQACALPCLPPVHGRPVPGPQCGYALWTAQKETP